MEVQYGETIPTPTPWSGIQMAVVTNSQLSCSDYDIIWNMGLPGGLTLMGPTVRISLDILAVCGEEPQQLPISDDNDHV